MGNVQEAMRDHAAWKASNPPSKDAHSATSTDAHSATKRPRLGTNAEPARESTGAYWAEAETGAAPEASEPGSESEAEPVGDGAEAMVGVVSADGSREGVEEHGAGGVESGNGTGAGVQASGTGGLVSAGGSDRVVSGDGTGALESVVTGDEPEAMEEDEVGMVDATLYPWQERLQQKCEFYFIYDLFLVNQFPSAFLIFVICSHFISQRYCL